LFDQADRLVDRDGGLALRVGVNGIDFVTVDAAMRIKPIYDDFGAKILKIRPAAGERTGEIINDADLDRLLRFLGSKCRGRKQRHRNDRRTA
jgi:hypothetical protein